MEVAIKIVAPIVEISPKYQRVEPGLSVPSDTCRVARVALRP